MPESTNLLRTFAVLLLSLLLGLALATVAISRDSPLEISGSPTPPEHMPRTPDQLLRGGDFVTRAPDGEAFVQMRFGSPQNFDRVVQSYDEVWAQYRIHKAAIQTSDDGIEWTKAAEATERNGQLIFDVRSAGAHAYWRMTVLESGDAPEVIFENLHFRRSDGILRRFPIDVAWLCLTPALILLFVSLPPRLSPGRLFVSAAIPVALFVSIYSFGYVAYHTINYNDSSSYLQRVLTGSYSPIRNSGYPLFLVLASKTLGLDRLAWLQLGTIIACYFAGVWLLVSHLQRKWLGLVLAVAFALQGATISFADQILTEALFTAGLTLVAAALGALAWRPGINAVIAGMIGIALATIAKSVGLVLVVPALLLVRFLPKGAWLRVSAPIVAAGLLTYGAMAVHGYSRTGNFAPESFAGFALIGQVGWMLDDNFMPQSELTRALRDAAVPVLQKRPADLSQIDSLATLNRYVDYTVQEYNSLLWTTLVPIAQPFPTVEAENAFFLQFAFSSIRAHPAAYLRHAAAHFYGLWRDMGQIEPLRGETIRIRAEPALASAVEIQLRNAMPGSILAPYPEKPQLTAERIGQESLPLALGMIWDRYWIRPAWTIAIGILALGLSVLFLIPGRLAVLYRTEIMIALSLNAYFAGHALLQVTLPRYAEVGILGAFMLVASFIATTLGALKTQSHRISASPSSQEAEASSRSSFTALLDRVRRAGRRRPG
ncbi:MAG: hypothetical protein QOD09_3725 [Bradyrhizobium sp.]|jgi:hypothetical protein|nr:hypothetical protein [Bradyrhizobium sp.]MEA2953402.1 hypothetical protein [Alphaproteobacteria bacterium]